MAEQKFCQDCNQKHNCREVYQKLGNTKGPPVVLKAVVAFLLPILVFIVSLAAFEAILARVKSPISTKELRTALSFVLALSVTLIVVGCSLLVGIGKSKIKMQRAKLQSKIQKAKLTTNQHESDTNFFRRD